MPESSTRAKPQPMQALEVARRNHKHCAELKRMIAEQDAGVARGLVANVLRDPQPAERGMRVEELIASIHRVGRRDVMRYLSLADVQRHDCRIRELTPGRTERLIELIDPPEIDEDEAA